MKKCIEVKKRVVIFSIFLVLIGGALCFEGNIRFPENINIYKGENLLIGSSSPYTLSMPAGFGGVLEENGQFKKDDYGGGERYVKADLTGNYSASVKLFGVIPVRDVNVSVSDTKTLIPGGDAIGIKMFADGLLCVGTSEVADVSGNISNPATLGDIRPGDIILAANDEKMITTENLAELIKNSDGKNISLTVKRGNEECKKTITPVLTTEGYKAGMWMRDSTAGIGTISFIDEEEKVYGALGHPICDSDTGIMVPVLKGSVVEAEIFGVEKGKKGVPGELKGTTKGTETDFGTIEKNSDCGIYGLIKNDCDDKGETPIPISSGGAVKKGKAQIISTIDESGKQAFDVEIVRVNRGVDESGKNMIIEVTDKRLLEKTGGIVQGMSGSPLVQNGKLIGAVTHVFVNDPTRGYGIFIENMLSEAEKIK